MLTMGRIVLIGILSFAMLTLVNLHMEPGSFLALTQTILSLFFIFFGSGYLVNAYLTDLKQRVDEVSVRVILRSITFSVTTTIVAAMATHYAGLAITTTNIMNILFVTIVALLVLNFFKILWSGTRRSKKGRREWEDKTEDAKKAPSDSGVLIHVLMMATVISIIVYLSAYLPTKEEFLQVYWDVREVQIRESIFDPENTEGNVLYGTVLLGNRRLPMVMYDLDEEPGFDTFCLDIDEDGRWCEDTAPGRNREGPINYFETFFIDGYAYRAVMFAENRAVFINYAEYLYQDTFRTSFNVRSHYSREVDLRLVVSVDEDIISTEDITLAPGQEFLKKVDIRLEEEGNYRVTARVEPLSIKEDSSSIHFFVDRRFE